MTMTNLKIAVLCLACIVFLAVGLVSLRAYQAPQPPINRGTAAADELKRAQDRLKAAEAEVARLEAAARAQARTERYNETVVEYYLAVGISDDGLHQQKAKGVAGWAGG